MKNPAKYAFTEIDNSECRGRKFDFATAQRYLGKKIPDDKVNFKRTDSEGKFIPIEKMTPNKKEVEKWHLAGDLIIESLADGDITALVKSSPGSNQFYAVPITYWQQSVLSKPTDSLLVLHSAEWQPFHEFHKRSFHLLESDIKSIIAAVPAGIRGPKERYDWAGCKAHIKDQFEENGSLISDDPDWSCQADVVRAMGNFFFILNPDRTPSHSLLKKWAKKFIDEFQALN